jgi:GT2 family glycosyltransferase
VSVCYVIGTYYGGGAVLEEQLRCLRTARGHGSVILWDLAAEKPPRGFSVTYNQLMEWACQTGADRIWMFNDDIAIDMASLICAESVLDDPTVGAVFPVEIMTDASSGEQFTLSPADGHRMSRQEALTKGPDLVERLFPGFACVCIPAKVWKFVGPMDESIGRGYAEDLDWGLRCWKSGYRVVNYRRATFWHQRGGTFGRLIKEGLWSEEESRESCLKAQAKWPFLWRENDEQILARLHAWYAEARAC